MSDQLGKRLERTPVPDADAARQRAWRNIVAAAPSAAPGRPRTAGGRRAIVALVSVAAVSTVAAAAASSAPVADWVKRRIDPAPQAAERAPAAVPARRLPAPGRLLARSRTGGLVLIDQEGGRRRLGSYRGASWSPHGLYIVAWRANQLSALGPDGSIRWQHTTLADVRAARWSPDGYRIAYVTRDDELRVIAGDGTGDRHVAHAGRAIPAWQPSEAHSLAFVTPGGRLVIQDVDTGTRTTVGRSAAPPVRTIAWAPRGRVLTTTSAHEARTFNLRTGARLRRHRRAPGRYIGASYAPTHRMLAVVTRGRRQSTVTAGAQRFTTAGRIASATWSPDGRWLLLDAVDAKQLIALRIVGDPRVQSYPGATPQDWSR